MPGKVSKDQLQGLKRVRVNGMSFTIKKINPLIDFSIENMPQIFSNYQNRRKTEPAPLNAKQLSSALKDMFSVVEAGLVEPKLIPAGKGADRGAEDGVTVEDIFRDQDLGVKLYWEIVTHALNTFKGIKGLFFYLRLRWLLWILLRGDTARSPQTSPLPVV